MFQASLLDSGEIGVGPLGPSVHRVPLSDGAWIDLRPSWITGADTLFQRLVENVPWRDERRRMYDRVIAVPRRLAFYHADDALPDPSLDEMKHLLDEHYAAELGEPFTTAGLCLYRDRHDSVAWHGDRYGRGRHEDTMVAIISLGTPRPLLLRPRSGGATLRFEPGHGDLLVMGGSCQRTWEHAVPKSARPLGPRVSVQFRPHDVR
jgi:alkylated DNA repair dioxygenase AlkB